VSRYFGNRIAVALLVAALASSAASTGRAQGVVKWQPNGVEPASSYNDRGHPVAVPDGTGGGYVAWQERGMVRIQHLTEAGAVAPGWNAETGIFVCREPNTNGWMQTSPRAVEDGTGGAFVLWHDERNAHCTISCLGDAKQIFLQRITPEGAISAGWDPLGVDVGSVPSQTLPTPIGRSASPLGLNTRLVSDGQGGVLIAWTDLLHGPTNYVTDVRVQRVNASGAKLWGDHGVLLAHSPSGSAVYPVVAVDGDGGAVVAWQEARETGGASRIYVQHVDAGGAVQAAAGGALFSEGPGASDCRPEIVALDHGDVLIAWRSASTESGPVALVTKVLFAGGRGREGAATVVAGSVSAEGEVALAADARHGAWISWIDDRDPAGHLVLVDHLSRFGEPANGWPEGGAAVSQPLAWLPPSPMLVDDLSGGVYVSWRDEHEPRMTHLLRAGSQAAGWPANGLLLSQPNYPDVGLHMIPDAAGGAIVVWDQEDERTGVEEVLGQRVGPSPSAKPVARRAGRESVLPSAVTRFALGGFQPNPAASGIGITIGFALPSAAPATLEVFDLFGRRLVADEVGSLGAGDHRMALKVGTLRPGLYAIRLRQGDRLLTTRGIVTP